MKKYFAGAAAVLLSGVMLVSLAGCGGAVSQAKSMQGEEVTEDVWNAAMAGTAYEEKALSVQTLAAEDGAVNFKAEYELTYDSTMEMAASELLGTEAMSANIKMAISSEVIVADHIVHITMDYDVTLDGSENLLAQMGMEDAASEKGTLEMYISYGDPVGVYVLVDGKWVGAEASVSGVSEIVQSMSEACMEIIDQSALVGAFSRYTYDADKKGYVAIDGSGSVSGAVGSFNTDGELIYKLRDGKLAAIYAQSSTDAGMEGVIQSSGTAEIGLVYTYGGQSNTLPALS